MLIILSFNISITGVVDDGRHGGHFEISKPQKVDIHLCARLSVFAVSMATAGILKFPSLKTIYTHAIQYFY
jgi:hypothetical protein